ncbi:MAG: hypothetical protein PHR63_08965, partial [Methanoregulaceae archaeon]|nr:hypothetical protein [Methanoregulaceae archaeon]
MEGKHGDHAGGHARAGSHHAHMASDFRRRFIVCAILTIPILVLSPMIQEWTGISVSFEGDGLVLFA